MKVSNFESSNGNPIANQFLIKDDKGNEIFQSYKSIIAIKDIYGKITLDERYWDYSQTTGKYRNQFLGETKRETLDKINSGVYTFANLN